MNLAVIIYYTTLIYDLRQELNICFFPPNWKGNNGSNEDI